MARRSKVEDSRIKITPRMDQQSLALRHDAMSNFLTGLGIEGRDSRRSNRLTWKPMSEMQAEAIFSGSGLSKRIASKLPSDALRRGIEFENFDKDAEVKKELRRLNQRAIFKQAAIWGRTQGGAHVFINDGTDPAMWEQPLDLKAIQQIKSLLVLSRWEMPIAGDSFESDIIERFGHPNCYRLSPHRTIVADPKKALAKIHHTRLISFHGNELPLMQWRSNSYYHDSVFNNLTDVLTDYLASNAGVAAALTKFRAVMHGIKNLADSVAAGGKDKIKQRVSDVNLVMSILNELVYDMENEKIEVHNDTYAGVMEILEGLKSLVASCTEYPKIILFNESPEGSMGGNGSSEMEGYYNTVEDYQEDYFRPKYDRFFEILFACKKGPTNGAEPDNWTFNFPPLWQLNRLQLAQAELAEAQADTARIEQGTQDELDIMEKRFPEKVDDMTDQDKANFREQKAMEEAQRQEMTARALAEGGPLFGQAKEKPGQGEQEKPDPKNPKAKPKK